MRRRLIRLEHYWPGVLAAACAAGLTGGLGAAAAGVLNVLSGDWVADVPPLMVLVVAALLGLGGLVVGLFAVPFLPLVIGPRFPFVRWGYVAVAALPFLFLAGAQGSLWAKVFYSLVLQFPLAFAALTFVAFGRWFGAFGDD